jgi:hypothetical protein
MDRARASVQRALTTEAEAAARAGSRGFLLMNGDPRDPAGAEAGAARVLDQDPNMSDALNWLQGALHGQAG